MTTPIEIKRAAFRIHSILSEFPREKHQMINAVLRSMALGSEAGLVIDGVEFKEVMDSDIVTEATEDSPVEVVDEETKPVVESTPDAQESTSPDVSPPDEVK